MSRDDRPSRTLVGGKAPDGELPGNASSVLNDTHDAQDQDLSRSCSPRGSGPDTTRYRRNHRVKPLGRGRIRDV